MYRRRYTPKSLTSATTGRRFAVSVRHSALHVATIETYRVW